MISHAMHSVRRAENVSGYNRAALSEKYVRNTKIKIHTTPRPHLSAMTRRWLPI